MKKDIRNRNIPFFIPEITEADKKAVLNSLKKPHLTDGPKLREFEALFAKFTGAKYAIGTSNATSALHLSILANGIGKGDEIIIPDMTFVATANAVIHAGAIPVFADVEKNSMNISIDSIKEKVNKKTKAILPVHFAGKSCDIKNILKICKENNLKLIEDCAHAIGARIGEKHVGTFGNAGCFSFYPTKNITTIEGGMVITNDKKIAQKISLLRNHGLTKTLLQRYSKGMPWDYDVIESGYNYRLDEIRSTLGISQLKRIEKLNQNRKKIYEYYNTKFENVEQITTPNSSKEKDHVYHLYIIRINKKSKISRDQLFIKLQKLGIKTTVHYKPLHKFSVFKKFKKKNNKFVNSTELYQEIMSLPFYPNMPKSQQDYVIKSIMRIVGNK